MSIFLATLGDPIWQIGGGIILLVKTIGPNGYTDDYERDFQFTLSVEHGAWKIAQIARCLADGCLPDTTDVVP